SLTRPSWRLPGCWGPSLRHLHAHGRNTPKEAAAMPRSRSLRSGLSRDRIATGLCRPCGLVRVSTDEQADQFSLPMQIEKVTAYCREQLGIELPEAALFREEGVSGRPGSLTKRPGLAAVLEACRAGRYTHLVVHKLDRLGRNVGLVSSVL